MEDWEYRDYEVNLDRDLFRVKDHGLTLESKFKELESLATVLSIIRSDNPQENPLAPRRGIIIKRVDVTLGPEAFVYTAHYEDGTKKQATGREILSQYFSFAP